MTPQAWYVAAIVGWAILWFWFGRGSAGRMWRKRVVQHQLRIVGEFARYMAHGSRWVEGPRVDEPHDPISDTTPINLLGLDGSKGSIHINFETGVARVLEK